MRISSLPGKLLSSVLSASMVIAFAPAVASAVVTSDEQQGGGELGRH